MCNIRYILAIVLPAVSLLAQTGVAPVPLWHTSMSTSVVYRPCRDGEGFSLERISSVDGVGKLRRHITLPRVDHVDGFWDDKIGIASIGEKRDARYQDEPYD
jgi:hypothetical protein